MSWEQRNADFCNAQTDAQMAYIEAEREVDRLQTENAKLRELVRELYHELDAATQYEAGGSRGVVSEFADRMRELGIEEDA